MRSLIISLALILSFLGPVWAQAPEPFVGAFISEDLWNNYSDNVHRFDVKWSASNWRDFDKFLKRVVQEAAGRQIVLDLSIHGLGKDLPLCAVGDDKRSYLATFGGVINHIEKYIPDAQLKAVIAENCYGAETYHGSINPPLNYVNNSKGCLLESRTKGNPKFIVYGFTNMRNTPPCGYEQYVHNQFVTLEDIRKYKDLAPLHLDECSEVIAKDLQRMILARLLFKLDGIERIILLRK